MAKKPLDIFNIVDPSLLDSLKPTEKEIELVSSVDGGTEEIPVEYLDNYHNHTYKVLDNEDMDLLVDSIKDYGILLPLLVRRKDGGRYEVISGHRRKFAAEKLGLETVPCKIMDVGDDMADIIMADTNIARETILPSEKARTYKVRLEAAVRLGKKTEDELKAISSDSSDSVSNVRRYLKLNDLPQSILDRIDENKIAVNTGVVLSDLPKPTLQSAAEIIEEHNISPSLKNAEKLKIARRPDKQKIYDILTGKTSTRKNAKKEFSESMLKEVLPARIKKLPLEERVEYYKEVIRFYEDAH